MRDHCLGSIKKTASHRPWRRFVKFSRSKLYSTISFSPEGSAPQQQPAEVRQLWQQSIMMALFIARSTPAVNTASSKECFLTLPSPPVGFKFSSHQKPSACDFKFRFPTLFLSEAMCVIKRRFNDN
jgi:hypothetical protein